MAKRIHIPELSGKNILLLGDSRMAFPIAKALAKSGANVYAGVSIYSNYLEWSRYVKATFPHPSTDAGTDAAAPYIFDWLKDNPQIDAIQPVSESASRLITRHREAFLRHGKLIMPSPETLAMCNHKGEMFQLCDELGIALAPYRRVHTTAGLLASAEAIGFPLIVKPSNVDAELFGRKALIATSLDHLNSLFPGWPDRHPELIIQRFVKGPRHSVIFSAQNGKLLKASEICAVRTHEDDGTGYTTLGVTVSPNALVREATEKLARKMNYSTTGCTQFIVDPASGEVTFMELNPRTSLARISEAAGVPHSVLGAALTLGLDLPDLGDPWDTSIGTRYVWTKGDLMRLKRGVSERRKSKSTALREMLGIGADALTAHHAIFDPLDPMPAIGTYFNIVIKHVRKPNPALLGQPSLKKANA